MNIIGEKFLKCVNTLLKFKCIELYAVEKGQISASYPNIVLKPDKADG